MSTFILAMGAKKIAYYPYSSAANLRLVHKAKHLNLESRNQKTHQKSREDYYPFGMIMPGRNFNADQYRFGFNGKEMDNEVSGNGNQYDYGFRIYNPRIGKFLSVDPLTKSYPMLTPYQFSSNRPIDGVDLDGLEYFNCTSIISLGAGATSGIGYGVNLSIEVGNAYDMVGTTQYIAYSVMHPGIQDLEEGTSNPQFILGADITAVEFGVDIVGEPTFEKSMKAMEMSMTSVDIKWGIGGSGKIGEKTIGGTFGFGIGGKFTTGQQEGLLESISITSEERSKTSFGSIWFVPEESVTRIPGKDGEVAGFKGQIYEFTVSPSGAINVLPTGLEATSGVSKVEEDGKTTYKSDKIWKTEDYKKEESEY